MVDPLLNELGMHINAEHTMSIPFRGNIWFEDIKAPNVQGRIVRTANDVWGDVRALYNDAPLSFGVQIMDDLFDCSKLDRTL